MRGNKPHNSVLGLIDWVKGLDDVSIKYVLELGVFSGESTILFAAAFPGVVAVDLWDDIQNMDVITATLDDMREAEQVFRSRMKERKNIIQMRCETVTAIRLLGHAAGLIYVDATHAFSTVKQELNEIKIARLGHRSQYVTAGHDWRHPGVKRAARQHFRREPEFVGTDGSWGYHIQPRPTNGYSDEQPKQSV